MQNFTITHIGNQTLSLPMPFIFIDAHKNTVEKPFIFQGDESLAIHFAESYWLCAHQCTQEFWEAVVTEAKIDSLHPKPSYFAGLHRPVEQVSWVDIQLFNEALNTLMQNGKIFFLENNAPNGTFGLPSETQWEYAANANQNFLFAGSENLNDIGWYNKNSDGETKPVGLKQPNAWGLYDMIGNIWEWCADDYIGDIKQITNDGSPNLKKDEFKTLRGGGCYYGAINCHLRYRGNDLPDYRNGNNGFRLRFSL